MSIFCGILFGQTKTWPISMFTNVDESEVSGSDISQSSEIYHGFFVKMTWIGCHVDGGWVRLLSGNKASQVF